MSVRKPKNIVIVGGSLGGLFIGIALKRLRKSLNIRILERTPTALLHDQGAGIVAGSEVQQFFETYDKTKTPISIPSFERLYLDKAGNVTHREKREQQMTSWDLLYHLLRANYDGMPSDHAKVPAPEKHEGSATYEYGNTVIDLEVPESRSTSGLDFSEQIELIIKNDSDETTTIKADLIIAADGPSSTIRSRYLPNIKREYAGYVAWRGTVREDQVSEAARDVFVQKFPFFHADHLQILAYTIPGKDGTLEQGKRLLNWVWYVNYEEGSQEQKDVMTDKDGKFHHITLPAGGVRDEMWARQKEYAKEVLPHQFAELVEKTEVPFVQAITDVISPTSVLAGGRVLLVGDALAGFRPHTAMSTGQAARDALTLAPVIEKIIDGKGFEVLEEWEEHVVEFATKLQSHGVWIGNRSQFFKHPNSG